MTAIDISLSVVIPAFNEENRIETPLPGVIQYLSNRFKQWEVIYSDDGSTDSTPQKLKQIQNNYPGIKIVRSEKNKGKGSAVKNGMAAATGDVVLFSDTDFSTPIDQVELLLSHLQNGSDVVIGSRGLPDSKVEIHQAWPRELMGKVFNRIIKTILPVQFMDTQCGFKLFNRKAVNLLVPRMSIEGFAFDVEMLIISQVHKLRVVEVPVVWRNILDSRVHPIRNSLEMLRDVTKIRFRLAQNHYS
ncbi:MAG TPA: dolichyl-phosphate beta-glucosyltransferase [Acidobacteriota bacterium]|nr:dolichyl-phosphate beta-glucosyltransferase [Acidobacteriota bacterium]